MFSLGELAVLLMSSPSSTTTPTLPGGIIAWIVCYRARRNPIGGWLLFFYWQMYGGILMTALLFSTNIQSYVKENFDSNEKFYMFLFSVIPTLTLLLAQVAVGTILLSARTWDLLKLLRFLIGAVVLAEILSIVININYNPDNLVFNFMTLVPETGWLAYFFNSKRVNHVFKTHDWETAVNIIHPNEKLAT
jgi:hypothetical protein